MAGMNEILQQEGAGAACDGATRRGRGAAGDGGKGRGRQGDGTPRAPDPDCFAVCVASPRGDGWPRERASGALKFF